MKNISFRKLESFSKCFNISNIYMQIIIIIIIIIILFIFFR